MGAMGATLETWVAPIHPSQSDGLPDGRLEHEEINRLLQGPGNGLQDIYWVSTEAIQLP